MLTLIRHHDSLEQTQNIEIYSYIKIAIKLCEISFKTCNENQNGGKMEVEEEF